MASGHTTTSVTLTTETAANRYRVALSDIGTQGAVILGYRMGCTAGTFAGSLYVVNGDPGAWGGTAITDPSTGTTIAMESEVLSLSSGVLARDSTSNKPGVVGTGAAAYLVLEDVGGTGLSGFSGTVVIEYSVL